MLYNTIAGRFSEEHSGRPLKVAPRQNRLLLTARYGVVLILLAIFPGSAVYSRAAVLLQRVTLAWTPDVDPNVSGYRIYYGVASHNYTTVVNAGNTSTAIIPNLTPGVTYYFAATSYTVAGLESVLSTEISYTPPLPVTQARLQISAPSGSNVVLTGTGLAGHIYAIQTTTNLTSSWTTLGNVTSDTNGLFQFTDPISKSVSQRFYRCLDTQP
jgi:hypothetical protein